MHKNKKLHRQFVVRFNKSVELQKWASILLQPLPWLKVQQILENHVPLRTICSSSWNVSRPIHQPRACCVRKTLSLKRICSVSRAMRTCDPKQGRTWQGKISHVEQVCLKMGYATHQQLPNGFIQFSDKPSCRLPKKGWFSRPTPKKYQRGNLLRQLTIRHTVVSTGRCENGSINPQSRFIWFLWKIGWFTSVLLSWREIILVKKNPLLANHKPLPASFSHVSA